MNGGSHAHLSSLDGTDRDSFEAGNDSYTGILSVLLESIKCMPNRLFLATDPSSFGAPASHSRFYGSRAVPLIPDEIALVLVTHLLWRNDAYMSQMPNVLQKRNV